MAKKIKPKYELKPCIYQVGEDVKWAGATCVITQIFPSENNLSWKLKIKSYGTKNECVVYAHQVNKIG